MDAVRMSRGSSSAWRQVFGLNARCVIQCTRALSFAVLSGVLLPGSGLAGYPAGVAGPDDISAFRTPWYYIHANPHGEACKTSAQGAIDPVLAWAATLGGTCSVSYTGIDPWPAVSEANTSVSYCAGTAGLDFGPLPDSSDQNAKPEFHQKSTFYWDRTVTNSVCPADLYTYPEFSSVDRYAYDYCPAGYGFYYSQPPGSYNFCRRGAEPERDQGEMCGAGDPLTAGDSIYLGTGKKYQRETDYVDGRDERFMLERHYDSIGNDYPGYTGTGMFGARWSSTFERSIGNTAVPSPQTVVAYRANGQRYYFNHVNGAWVSNSAVREILVRTPTGWSYTTARDVSEHYDVGGRLLSIVFPDGVTQSLSYDLAGRLSRVQATTGESLSFAYRMNHAPDLVESVTDHTGRTWRYRYNDQHSTLESVAYPDDTPADMTDNPERRYHYEDPNFPEALTGITDERGIRFSSYAYDSQGRAVSSYRGGGIGRVDVDYNGTDDYSDGAAMRTVTNSNGTTAYTTRLQNGVALLQDLSRPVCTTCGTGDSDYRYDTVTNVLLEKTVHGVTTEFGNHTVNGNAGYMIEAKGTAEERRTDYTYDTRYFSKIETITEPSVHAGSNKVTAYTYDDFGNRTSETINGFTTGGTAVSRATSWQYSGPFHQLSEINGPRDDQNDAADITRFRYRSFDPNAPSHGPDDGRLKEIEDANGDRIRHDIHYTSTGKILYEYDANNIKTEYEYDHGNDRLKRMGVFGSGGTQYTEWTYLDTGEVETIATAHGTQDATVLTFGYDAARRLVRITDGLGNYIKYTLDTEGNREKEEIYDANGTLQDELDDVLKKTLTQSFDIYNRLDLSKSGSDPINPLEQVDSDFSADGSLDRQTDGSGIVTDYGYDNLRRLLSSTRDLGGLDAYTLHGYDVADRLISVTDPNDGTTSNQYDDLGNLLSTTSPDTGTTTYSYDAAGNVKTMTFAAGPGDAVTLQYSYDALNRLAGVDAPGTRDDRSYVYGTCTNGAGRLCQVATSRTAVSYSYDAFGNITDHQGVVYTYDDANRVETMTYPSGAVVTYVHDLAGQVKRVDLSYADQTQTLAASIAHHPFGPVDSLLYGNGATLAQRLDEAYRVTDIDVPGLLELDYLQYDLKGNLEKWTNMLTGQTRDFGYDALDRLDTVDTNVLDYDYDLNGNRKQLIDGGTTTVYDYSDQTNRMIQAGPDAVVIDSRGNTTVRGAHTYTYTAQNRLYRARLNGALVLTNRYNGLGQLDRKVQPGGGVTTGFTYGLEGQLLAETRDSGSTWKDYIYLDGQLLAVRESTVSSGTDVIQASTPAIKGQSIAVRWAGIAGPTPLDWVGVYEVGATVNHTYKDWAYTAGSSDGSLQLPLNHSSLVPGQSYEIRLGANDGYTFLATSAPFVLDPTGPTLIVASTPMAQGGTATMTWSGIASPTTTDWIGIYEPGSNDFAYLDWKYTDGQSDGSTGFAFDSASLVAGNSYEMRLYANDGYTLLARSEPFTLVDSATAGEASAVYYVHNDHLGTPQVMTDENGNPVWKAVYDPFGKATIDAASAVEMNVRFPGQYFDSETGLHYNYYRYYDPSTGRYLTADPIGIIEGEDLNLYAYVGNDPVNWIDPLGLLRSGRNARNYPNGTPRSTGRTNGNLFGEFTRQDNICSAPADSLNSNSCTKQCCVAHDQCYTRFGCNASSWVGNLLHTRQACQLCNSLATKCVIESQGKTDCDSPCSKN